MRPFLALLLLATLVLGGQVSLPQAAPITIQQVDSPIHTEGSCQMSTSDHETPYGYHTYWTTTHFCSYGGTLQTITLTANASPSTVSPTYRLRAFCDYLNYENWRTYSTYGNYYYCLNSDCESTYYDYDTRELTVSVSGCSSPYILIENAGSNSLIFSATLNLVGQESSTCSYYYSCESCTLISGCGYCASTSACVAGSSYGPTYVSCSNWDYYSSDCSSYYAGSFPVGAVVGGVIGGAVALFFIFFLIALSRRRAIARAAALAARTSTTTVVTPSPIVIAPAPGPAPGPQVDPMLQQQMMQQQMMQQQMMQQQQQAQMQQQMMQAQMQAQMQQQQMMQPMAGQSQLNITIQPQQMDPMMQAQLQQQQWLQQQQQQQPQGYHL